MVIGGPARSLSQETGDAPRFLGNPWACMPRSSTPVGRPLLALAETVDGAFRLENTVGPTIPFVSRRNHAASMLAVYASPCESPQHGARLASRSLARRYRDRTFISWVPYSNFQGAFAPPFPTSQTFPGALST
jgi:hypothetical protein